MEKIKVKELIREIKESTLYFEGEDLSDLRSNFAEYGDGYICDIISSVADDYVDIYTYDLMQWNADNYDWVEKAIDEFGAPERFDMCQAIRQGQYLMYTQAIYENLSECIKLAILENIAADEITNEILERIDELADEEDNNAMLSDYIEEINNMEV